MPCFYKGRAANWIGVTRLGGIRGGVVADWNPCDRDAACLTEMVGVHVFRLFVDFALVKEYIPWWQDILDLELPGQDLKEQRSSGTYRTLSICAFCKAASTTVAPPTVSSPILLVAGVFAPCDPLPRGRQGFGG